MTRGSGVWYVFAKKKTRMRQFFLTFLHNTNAVTVAIVIENEEKLLHIGSHLIVSFLFVNMLINK